MSAVVIRPAFLPRALRAVGLAAASLLLLIYVLAPVAWLLSSSLQTEREIVSIPPHWIPDHPTLQNFRAIFLTGLGYAQPSANGVDPTSGGSSPPLPPISCRRWATV